MASANPESFSSSHNVERRPPTDEDSKKATSSTADATPMSGKKDPSSNKDESDENVRKGSQEVNEPDVKHDDDGDSNVTTSGAGGVNVTTDADPVARTNGPGPEISTSTGNTPEISTTTTSNRPETPTRPEINPNAGGVQNPSLDDKDSEKNGTVSGTSKDASDTGGTSANATGATGTNVTGTTETDRGEEHKKASEDRTKPLREKQRLEQEKEAERLRKEEEKKERAAEERRQRAQASRDAKSQSEQEIRDLKEKLKDANGKIDELEKEKAKAETDRDTATAETTAALKDKDALIVEQDGLKDERDRLVVERDGLKDERDRLVVERDGLKVDRDGLKTERDDLKAKRDGLIVDRDALILERTALILERDAKTEKEGKPEFVVRVMLPDSVSERPSNVQEEDVGQWKTGPALDQTEETAREDVNAELGKLEVGGEKFTDLAASSDPAMEWLRSQTNDGFDPKMRLPLTRFSSIDPDEVACPLGMVVIGVGLGPWMGVNRKTGQRTAQVPLATRMSIKLLCLDKFGKVRLFGNRGPQIQRDNTMTAVEDKTIGRICTPWPASTFVDLFCDSRPVTYEKFAQEESSNVPVAAKAISSLSFYHFVKPYDNSNIPDNRFGLLPTWQDTQYPRIAATPEAMTRAYQDTNPQSHDYFRKHQQLRDPKKSDADATTGTSIGIDRLYFDTNIVRHRDSWQVTGVQMYLRGKDTIALNVRFQDLPKW